MNKCFVSGIIGAFCMLFLIFGYAAFDNIILNRRDAEQDQERISFVSSIDKQDCFVCGEHTDPLTAHYWNEDNIGILNLNTFEMMYIEINRYDDNSELIQEPADVLVSDGLKCEDSWLHSMTDPDRGYSHIDISNITREIDAESLQSRLCQGCLDQINSDCFFDSQPAEYAVISFAEKRIHAVTDSLRWYAMETYSVYTDFDEDSVRLMVEYCPVRYEKICSCLCAKDQCFIHV